jgi:hypothetical protein
VFSTPERVELLYPPKTHNREGCRRVNGNHTGKTVDVNWWISHVAPLVQGLFLAVMDAGKGAAVGSLGACIWEKG